MAEDEGVDQRSTPLMKYLRSIQDRPGWSVARMARASGLHRTTIFRMMSGETRRVSIETVRRIAVGVGDDPDMVLATVAGSLDVEAEDHRLAGLDANDEVVKIIMAAEVDEDYRDMMLERHRENLEYDRQRYLEQVKRDVTYHQRLRQDHRSAG